jgi:hypothetical protein
MPKVPMPEQSYIPMSTRAKRPPLRETIAQQLSVIASGSCGDPDLHDLTEMNGLAAMSTLIDELILAQVVEMKTFGYSWLEIGAALGMTKQATQQRYGKSVNTD